MKTHPQICIGEYIDSYFPAVDGVIVTVQNYAKWMNKNHCECYVATTEAPKDYVDTDPFKVIRYHSVPVPKRPPYRFGVPLLDWGYMTEQHQMYPDLVHAHSPFLAGREALRIAKSRNIPLVASFHSKYYDDILQVTNSRFLSDTAIKLIVDFYNEADYVWTVNQGTAETLREYGYGGDLEIMPNGTDFLMPKDCGKAIEKVNKRFHFTKEDHVILFVGQHIYQKNPVMLLEAAALYKQNGGRFKLLMVGDGYAKADLERMAVQLGLSDVITFAGLERDRATLSSYYLRADVFAFPSIYDNAPLVVREAAMANCPSILVAGTNAAENCVDNDNAFLCENSPESLCGAITRAFTDDDNRKHVGQRASETIAKPWKEIIERVFARYLQIMDEQKKN
ncbi:MAG: glycosyltransferase [Anaerofustis sp.]